MLAFSIMRELYENNFTKAVLVSGDGDYKPMVDYLYKENKLKKILVPNMKFASSLYKNDITLKEGFLVWMEDLRKKLEYEKRPHKDLPCQ